MPQQTKAGARDSSPPGCGFSVTFCPLAARFPMDIGRTLLWK